MSILSDQRRLVPFVLLYLVFVSAVIYLAFSHWGYDDPYITYRYAHNLLAGGGLAYNPGEHVLSTTTPLFTLLLALGGIFWADLPHLAILIGAAALALGGLFLGDMARSWKTPAVGWAGLLVYPFFPLLLSTLGSETPLYLAFCLGSFAFYARQRYTWSALFAALAVLARPDGILVVAVLAADFLIQKRQPVPWRAVAVFLSCLLSWLIFAWAYFGTPLPATLSAKQHQAAMAISQGFASGFWSLVKEYGRHWFYWVDAALALVGLVFAARNQRRWLLLLAWSTLYFTSYSILGVSRYFWYYAPLVPALIVLVGMGIAQLEKWAGHPILVDRTRQAPHLLAAALLLFLVIGEGIYLTRMREHPDQRIQIYRLVGEWLRSETPETARIGALEVGIIGYYSDRFMVDFSGLIQPDVARQMNKNTNYDDSALWAVQKYHPGYLLLQQGVFPRLEQSYVSQQCQKVTSFQGAPYHYAYNLDLYSCRQ